jgi:hypothetical protein
VLGQHAPERIADGDLLGVERHDGVEHRGAGVVDRQEGCHGAQDRTQRPFTGRSRAGHGGFTDPRSGPGTVRCSFPPLQETSASSWPSTSRPRPRQPDGALGSNRRNFIKGVAAAGASTAAAVIADGTGALELFTDDAAAAGPNDFSSFSAIAPSSADAFQAPRATART